MLVFVATSTEHDQLKARAAALGLSFAKRKGRFGSYYDLGTVGANRVLAVKTQIGAFGHRGSAASALLYLSETGATGIVSVGMCFGIDRTAQKVGDVLVSSGLVAYDDREVCDQPTTRWDYRYRNPALYRSKGSLYAMLQRSITQLGGSAGYGARTGALLTGGARISSRDYRDMLVEKLSVCGEPIVGGEMEGAGLLSSSDPGDPVWIVVKGICDFADSPTRATDAERTLACRNACDFLLKALAATIT